MVKASRPAASQLAAMPISITANRLSTTPSVRASAPCTLPEATGRVRVRFITASISASNHMFSAPEAPAPTATHSTEMAAMTGLIGVRAATSPVRAVNTTSDMTRGFSSWT